MRDVFPSGPFDKSVLTEYGAHIARCIYARYLNYKIITYKVN
jgi:hypothetical protein